MAANKIEQLWKESLVRLSRPIDAEYDKELFEMFTLLLVDDFTEAMLDTNDENPLPDPHKAVMDSIFEKFNKGK
jgi:hypothetical protein